MKFTKMKKRTVRENVESILRDFPATRNDDKILTLSYWKLIDDIDMSSESAFVENYIKKATPPESIRRARQLVQEEGLYLPIDEVAAQRRGRELGMNKAIMTRDVV